MKVKCKHLSILLGLLTVNNVSFADTPLITPNQFYVGIFGGGGSSNNIDVNQYGTVFLTEAAGGALPVNAFGNLDSKSTGYFGVQLGLKAQEILFNPQWSMIPAVELEGFYTGKSSFNDTLFNSVDRVEEHQFDSAFPMKSKVFLTNAILNLSHTGCLIHAFLGLGIGAAIVNISDATSFATVPPEPNLNHFNTNDSDTATTFAGLVKVGLSYDLTSKINLFAEYRWLYIASTDFTFGSTIYPSHATTSNWNVQLGAQQYNLGDVGIRVNL
jgi:opacity protein-like surface antigen